MIKELLLAGAGSFAGGAIRYLVSQAVRTSANGFPWGTFVVNVTGCLLIGLLWGWTSRVPNLPQHVNLLLGAGFCGGFTTFSTFSKESLLLLQSGCYTSFALHVFGSLLFGLLATGAGFALAK